MADNTKVLNPRVFPDGVGDTIATDDIKGVKYQRVKIVLGADGVNNGDVSAANPVPVSAASMPLPAGAAIAANQQTDALTNTQLRASPVPVVTAAVSTLNSTTATLASGATFTGTGEDVSIYPSVVIALKTDQDGTLYMEFSPDNTNWDSSLSFPATAGVNEVHRLSVTRQYYRARFTNTAGSAQTYFRLQSTFGAQPPLTSPLNSVVQSDADALVTRSVGVGETPLGSLTNTKQDGLGFSTTALLTNGQTYSSGVLSLVGYTQVQTGLLSVGAGGTVSFKFYEDSAGDNLLRTVTLNYLAGDGFKMFSAPAFAPYVQYEFTCTSAGQTQFYFDTKFLTKSISGQIINLTDDISGRMVANLGRNVLVGSTDGGDYKNVPVTPEGHLEVAIHGPRLPFGSIHTESLTPVFQTDGVYGINPSEVVQTTGLSYDPGPAIGSNSGSNTGTGNVMKCSTGTTAYSFATMQSRRRLRYRPGQGIVGRFTALFSAPVASSILAAGFGTGESGFYFGYNGTSFGILHSTGGAREIQTFTVTNRTTTGGTVTFRLNGLDTQVTLAVGADTTATAVDIAAQAFPGWSVEARGETVIFLANSVGNKAGTFSITLGTAIGTAGTFAETLAGAASTDVWIAQADWNGDTLQGTGASGVTADWSKGNVFQIGIQYLGFGAISFQVETCPSNGNNTEFVTVHTIRAPNTRTTTTLTQPSFPFTMAAYSAGSTTDVSVSIGSFAGFVEGRKQLTGPRMSYFNAAGVASSTSAYTPIFTVRNDYIYALRANQAVVNLLSIGGATKSTNGITSFYVIRNATLSAGTPNFTSFSTQSCTYWDTAATACTFADNAQIVWTGATTGDGQFVFSFTDDLTLQPGETLTLAVRSVTGTALCIGQLNTREDQ